MPLAPANRNARDRHMLTPEPDQLREAIDAIRRGCDDLEKGVYNHDSKARGAVTVYELEEIERQARKDGYPASSGRMSGPPASVKDDEGRSMPPVSDPVGETVLAREASPMRHMVLRVGSQLLKAQAAIDTAVTVLKDAEPPPMPSAEPGCVSCARLGVWSSTYCSGKAGSEVDTHRCRWCYDYSRAHAGTEPPLELLQMHHDGKRITQNVIDKVNREQAIADAQERAKRRGKKGRARV